jgi:tetratricopeptide (TPR) repeat protein
MPYRFLAALGLLLLARSSEAEEAWIELSSPNFVLVTNASEGRGRSLLETGERFRAALGQVLPQVSLVTQSKTRLYGFRDAVSLEPFLPIQNGAPAYAAGYFRSSELGSVVVLDLGLREHTYAKVLFHEYVHLALSLSRRALPLWFEEGLSELYAGTRIESSYVELGAPEERHVLALARTDLVPLEELLAVDETSPWYRDAQKSSVFYAQSWALVHYLLVAAPRGQEQLARFLARAASGEEPKRAFALSFEREPSVVEEELRRYVKEREYPTLRFPHSLPDEGRAVAARRLPRAEVELRWGELFLANGRSSEARVCLEESARLDPELAPARESLGFLHLREGDPEAAKAELARAIELDGASAEGLYRYAKLVLADYGGQWVSTIPDGVARTAIDVLKKSLVLEPGARRSSELLAFVYLVRSERLDEAQALVEAALASSPDENSLLFLYAQLLAKKGLYAQARDVLARIDTKDPALREAISGLGSRLDGIERAPNR